MKILPTLICCAFIALATLDATSAATMRLYRGSINDYIETPINDFVKMYSYIDKQKNITMYASGYQNNMNGDYFLKFLNTLISRNTTNVMLIDWEKESQGEGLLGMSVPAVAAASAKRIGLQAGRGLIDLIEDLYFFPNNIRLFGFDLGADVMGWVGKSCLERGYLVSRIYAIDPVDVKFDSLIASDGLSIARAQAVIILHTNPGGYGADNRFGTVDFWPNCGNEGLQPGCDPETALPLIASNECSHGRGLLIAAEALLNPTAFPAARASSCSDWQSQTSTSSQINYYGDNVDISLKGNFYFSTNRASPYSKGKNGAQSN